MKINIHQVLSGTELFLSTYLTLCREITLIVAPEDYPTYKGLNNNLHVIVCHGDAADALGRTRTESVYVMSPSLDSAFSMYADYAVHVHPAPEYEDKDFKSKYHDNEPWMYVSNTDTTNRALVRYKEKTGVLTPVFLTTSPDPNWTWGKRNAVATAVYSRLKDTFSDETLGWLDGTCAVFEQNWAALSPIQIKITNRYSGYVPFTCEVIVDEYTDGVLVTNITANYR